MTRWLAILALLVAVPAEAQVFKPKSGSSTTTAKSATKSSSTKKAKKASARKAKKSTAAKKGRPSDLTPDDVPKVDPDYVKIIDDDDD